MNPCEEAVTNLVAQFIEANFERNQKRVKLKVQDVYDLIALVATTAYKRGKEDAKLEQSGIHVYHSVPDNLVTLG